jgi:hypothetical protein
VFSVLSSCGLTIIVFLIIVVLIVVVLIVTRWRWDETGVAEEAPVLFAQLVNGYEGRLRQPVQAAKRPLCLPRALGLQITPTARLVVITPTAATPVSAAHRGSVFSCSGHCGRLGFPFRGTSLRGCERRVLPAKVRVQSSDVVRGKALRKLGLGTAHLFTKETAEEEKQNHTVSVTRK